MATYSVSSGEVSTGTLASATGKTLVLLNPVTDKLKLVEVWVSFGATSAQADVVFDIYRVVTIGSAAGTASTVVKDDPNEGAASVTGLHNLTTEPTTIEILRSGYLTTQTGLAVVYFPLGREPIAAAAGARIGVRIYNDGASAMTAVNARATMVVEE